MSDRPTDEGFTLVELLIAMVITGIVTATIGAAMIVGLKTSDATGERLNESHDAQLLATYLIADLQSVGETGVTKDFPGPPICTAAETGYTSLTNALRLRWDQAWPTATTYTAEYRRAYDPATMQWVLLRKTCNSAGGADMRVVAHQLHPTIPVDVDVTQPRRVVLTVTEPTGYVYSVAGTRRTPDASPLPVAPWACTVLSAVGTPDPATRTTVAPGPLQEDEDIVVQTGGACSNMTIEITPGGSGSTLLPLTESPAGSGRYVRKLERDTYAWTDGEKLFPIRMGSTTLATLRLTVKQACLASQFLAAPSTVQREDGAAPGPLSTDVVLTATTSGICLPLEVRADRGDGTLVTQALTETSPGSWSGTMVKGSAVWRDGARTLELLESSTPAVIRTAPLQVAPSCIIAAAASTPNPVGRTGPGKNQLEADVQLTLSSSGICSAVRVTYTPGGSGSAAAPPVLLTEGAPGSWTGTVPASAGLWTSGTKRMTITDAYANDLGYLDLVVTN